MSDAPPPRLLTLAKFRRCHSKVTDALMEGRTKANRMDGSQNQKWKTRIVEGAFPDRDFDIAFWQEQGDEAIFLAAWEMVEFAEEVKYGRRPTLQRTVTSLISLDDVSANKKASDRSTDLEHLERIHKDISEKK